MAEVMGTRIVHYTTSQLLIFAPFFAALVQTCTLTPVKHLLLDHGKSDVDEQEAGCLRDAIRREGGLRNASAKGLPTAPTPGMPGYGCAACPGTARIAAPVHDEVKTRDGTRRGENPGLLGRERPGPNSRNKGERQHEHLQGHQDEDDGKGRMRMQASIIVVRSPPGTEDIMAGTTYCAAAGKQEPVLLTRSMGCGAR